LFRSGSVRRRKKEPSMKIEKLDRVVVYVEDIEKSKRQF
jgi:hypothetical protein